MAHIFDTIEVCEDCQAHENDPTTAEGLTTYKLPPGGSFAATGKCTGISSYPCEGCGEDSQGYRYEMVILV